MCNINSRMVRVRLSACGYGVASAIRAHGVKKKNDNWLSEFLLSQIKAV